MNKTEDDLKQMSLSGIKAREAGEKLKKLLGFYGDRSIEFNKLIEKLNIEKEN